MPNKLSDIITNNKKISVAAYSLRISGWFKEEIFARLIKNAGILLSGNVISALLRLAALAIITRALSPADFGLLVLIETYAAIFDLLFNFQSWQALIKYGADALKAGDDEGFKKLIKFGTILDVGSALLATLFAVSLAHGISQLFGWAFELKNMIMIYSFVILFNLSGTPTAILRLFDKFKLFTIQNVLTSVIKLFFVAVAYFYDAGLEGFILIWLITGIFQNLFLFASGWWIIRSKGYKNIINSSIKNINKKFNGIWHFVWASNINATLIKFTRHFDKFIILYILNTEAVAFYKLVQSINSIIARLIDPLYVSVYPELAKLVSDNNIKELNRLLKRTSFIIFLVALFLYVGAIVGIDVFVKIIFGDAYEGVGKIALCYIFGTLISVIFYYAQPLVLAFGQAPTALKINIFNIFVYISMLYTLTYTFGLIGAAISFSVFMILSVFFRLFYIQKKYNVFFYSNSSS